jgi:hypothetical protein
MLSIINNKFKAIANQLRGIYEVSMYVFPSHVCDLSFPLRD